MFNIYYNSPEILNNLYIIIFEFYLIFISMEFSGVEKSEFWSDFIL